MLNKFAFLVLANGKDDDEYYKITAVGNVSQYVAFTAF